MPVRVSIPIASLSIRRARPSSIKPPLLMPMGAAASHLPMSQRALAFMREHFVLLAAAVAAVASMFSVPPDRAYLGYIDGETLGCLFCVLAVANAFRYLGAFDRLGRMAIERFDRPRSVVMALVLTTGALSMVATNDLALIVMLPLSATTLVEAGWERWIAPTFVMQGLAANLCGMVLPFGNPQNLYLYSFYSLGSLEFLRVMVPPFVASTVIVMVGTWFLMRNSSGSDARMEPVSRLPLGRRRLAAYSLLLVLTALAVFRVIPVLAVLVVVVGVLAYADRRALKAVDYPLLLTFVCFFVFAGNMARMPFLADGLAGLMASDGLLASAALSQVISNVPAAVLLSHFTGDWASLLAGVNIGGAGTLVGSLASLITLQHFISVPKVFPHLGCNPSVSLGRFLKLFAGFNFGSLVVLFAVCRLCGL